uniref:Uncharacterized protein n=1 Tax=Setaria italica TaxID=4555 RepID=K3YNR4_SETIT
MDPIFPFSLSLFLPKLCFYIFFSNSCSKFCLQIFVPIFLIDFFSFMHFLSIIYAHNFLYVIMFS